MNSSSPSSEGIVPESLARWKGIFVLVHGMAELAQHSSIRLNLLVVKEI